MTPGRTRTAAAVAGWSPAETIDARKQARIVRATQMFLVKQPRHAQRAIRFDVVAFDGSGGPNWIKSAFDAA